MDTLKSRKVLGVVALSLVFAVFASVVISNSLADTASAAGGGDQGEAPKGDPHKPKKPEITVQSAAIARGECLVTHQKELERPVAGVEPEFAQVFDENGDPVFDENGDEVHEPTGEFRDVLREIEIIRAISTCAQSDPDHDDFMFTTSQLETFMSTCTKQASMEWGWCDTQRFEEHRDDGDDPEPEPPEPEPNDDPIEPPDPQTEDGLAVVAVRFIGDENGLNEAGSHDPLKNWGLTETLFRRNAETDATESWLATSWEIASDLSSVTIEIDTSAEFRFLNEFGDLETFGNVTAHDVAFSMNNANAATNGGSVHGQAGDFAGLWGEWVAINDTTIEVPFNSFDSTWNADHLNESGQAFSVFSESVFIDEGPDFVRDNIVATGVYLVDDWSPFDQVTMISAEAAGAGPHWLLEAQTSRVQLIQVPDAGTRAALLANGEVDAALLDAPDVSRFTDGGFDTSSPGAAIQIGVFFSGNLWEVFSAQDGSELSRGTFVHDLAWISRSEEEDFDDYIEAKSIRNALARAVDRHAINDDVLGGIGWPVEVEYVSALHSRWDDAWNYGYDPDLAIDIIRGDNGEWPNEGSYRKDQTSDEQQDFLNDNAFSVSIYAGPELGGGTGLNGELTDAVAGYWADLGLTVFSLKFSYVTFRPTVVGRTNTHPWMTSCDKGREGNPWHFPKGLVQTSLTRGGFGCGFEIPFILDNYQQVASEPDENVRNELVDEYVRYVYDEALQPGVVAVPQLYGMNPIKVAGWDQGVVHAGVIGRLWNLELN